MKMELSALEMRVVRFLGENYPVTTDDLRKGLSVRPDSLSRALKSLAAKGIIELEPLPDKTYVRLLIPGLVAESPAASARTAEDRDTTDDDSFMYM